MVSPTLGQVGEKALISHLLPLLGSDERLLTGFGQDAAALQLDQPTSTVAFKIDRAARPVALSRGWADTASWGRLAVTANCSDLLATSARPFAFMLSVTLPPVWTEEDYQRLVLGAKAECDAHGVLFAGGDTKEGTEPVVVGAAIGTLRHPPLSRTSASPGDALVVTGRVGGFLGAYLLLERSSDARQEDRSAWIEYLSRPRAHWNEAAHIASAGIATAAVDTSDGIYDGILELTRGSLGLRIDLTRVPWHPYATRCAEELGLPLRNFLFGGGDWNLLYAVDDAAASHLSDNVSANVEFHRIGAFERTPHLRALDDEGMFDLTGPRGEHFRRRLEDGKSFALHVATGNWFHPVS